MRCLPAGSSVTTSIMSAVLSAMQGRTTGPLKPTEELMVWAIYFTFACAAAPAIPASEVCARAGADASNAAVALVASANLPRRFWLRKTGSAVTGRRSRRHASSSSAHCPS
jgi:hypothetical protein